MSYVRQRCAAEAVGTLFIVFLGCGAASLAKAHILADWAVSLVFGITVTVMIASKGHVSKAHFNPAVTLGFWSAGWIRSREVLPYILAQCLGAIVGSLLLQLLLPVEMAGLTSTSLSFGMALGWEILLSFILMLVIFAVATDERVDSALGPLVIGATVLVCAMVGGPMTGASMNPARSLGPALILNSWSNFWVYVIGPSLGCVAAVRFYNWVKVGDAVALSPSRSAEKVLTP